MQATEATQRALERRIDTAASSLALGLSDAIRHEKGERGEYCAIFGPALAALCDATSPGYTAKQGSWWNTAVGLLRTALTCCDEDGYKAWQEDGVRELRNFVEGTV